MHNESEFYVGYLPMPAGLRRFVRSAVVALGVGVAGVAAALIAGQNPFASSQFEFQQYREFQGTLLNDPYPSLLIAGQGLPWLLVGPGKHGVADMRALDGREVRLRGERIIRSEDHMIEMAGQPSVNGSVATLPPRVDLGSVNLTGEIVDSKCYFGVMNPGAGKVHRDCAVRCISGGVPPAFLVRDAAGNSTTILLAHWNRALLDHIAEPIAIRGRLVREAGRMILYQE